jgi:hypothetical protein
MSFNQLPEKLKTLLLENTIEELAERDKQQILKYMTTKELEQYEQLIQKTKSAMDEPLSLSQKAKAGELRKLVTQKRHPKIAWWKRPVPLWQAAAVILMMLIGGYLILNEASKGQQKIYTSIHDTLYIKQIDTFFKEVETPLQLSSVTSSPKANKQLKVRSFHTPHKRTMKGEDEGYWTHRILGPVHLNAMRAHEAGKSLQEEDSTFKKFFVTATIM